MGTMRHRKGVTAEFIRAYLDSNPGTKALEIIAAGKSRDLTKRSIYRNLGRLVAMGKVGRAQGRHWLGRIGNPDLEVAAEVERVLAMLRLAHLSPEANLEAARQLTRESSRASSPRSRAVVDLLALLTSQPTEVQEALLPFAQRALRGAAGPGPGGSGDSRSYARRVWAAARPYLEGFLSRPGDVGTLAWNAVHPVVEAEGFLGDGELLGLAGRAVELESEGGLPPPSAARAVLRKVVQRDRLREPVRQDVLRRLSTQGGTDAREWLQRLLEDLDLKPTRDPPGG